VQSAMVRDFDALHDNPQGKPAIQRRSARFPKRNSLADGWSDGALQDNHFPRRNGLTT
jgi:hypothetical protein